MRVVWHIWLYTRVRNHLQLYTSMNPEDEAAHAVVKFKQHVWHACPNLRWRKDNGILFVSWSSNMSDVQLVREWSISSYCLTVNMSNQPRVTLILRTSATASAVISCDFLFLYRRLEILARWDFTVPVYWPCRQIKVLILARLGIWSWHIQ